MGEDRGRPRHGEVVPEGVVWEGSGLMDMVATLGGGKCECGVRQEKGG